MYLEAAPSIAEVMRGMSKDELGQAIAASDDTLEESDRYLHWDKLRRLPPPAGLTSEQWWLKVKLARKGELRRIPLSDPNGAVFGSRFRTRFSAISTMSTNTRVARSRWTRRCYPRIKPASDSSSTR